MNAVAVIEPLTAREELLLIAGRCISKQPSLSDAADALLVAIRNKPELRAALLDQHEHQVAMLLVGSLLRSRRSKIWNNGIVATSDGRQTNIRAHESAPSGASADTIPPRMAAMAAGVRRSNLLDFPLPSGRRLKDALGVEVVEASDIYRKQGADMLWKARWLSAVAARVGSGRVGDALTENDLATLRMENANA